MGTVFLKSDQKKKNTNAKVADFKFHVEFPHKADVHKNLNLLVIANEKDYKIARKLSVGTVYSSKDFDKVLFL